MASGWAYYWQGTPRFLIDARLFPGSSGSIVTTKGIDRVNVGGTVMTAAEPMVALLGVYAGEPLLPTGDPLDLGSVTYASLIPEIIEDGIECAEAALTVRPSKPPLASGS